MTTDKIYQEFMINDLFYMPRHVDFQHKDPLINKSI